MERVPLSVSPVYDVVLVAFEGPDRYSFVGGLATRMIDLADALVSRGYFVHHLFVGDPTMPAREERAEGRLVLERWSQWISGFHPRDVYDGEDGKWRDFERADAAIRVKIFGPLIWTVHRPVLFSAHGPVFKTDHGVFAVRYAGMGEVRQVLQYYRLNKARNIGEWKAAMRLQALPSINYVYADEKGNVGYVYNGQFPIRKAGVNWQSYLPGDRSDLIWHSYLPFGRLPQLWNPTSGFVFNSNNTPFQATTPEDDLKATDFPDWMGIQTNMTNRALRALETFGADNAISADEFRKYKFDVRYSSKSEVAKMIAEVCAFPDESIRRMAATVSGTHSNSCSGKDRSSGA